MMRKKKEFLGRNPVIGTVLISNHIERLTRRIWDRLGGNPNLIGSAVATLAIDYDMVKWLEEIKGDYTQVFALEPMDDFNELLKSIGEGTTDVQAKFRLFGLHVMHYTHAGDEIMSVAPQAMFNGRMIPAPELDKVRDGKQRRRRPQILRRLVLLENAWTEFEKTFPVPREAVKLYDVFPDLNPAAVQQ